MQRAVISEAAGGGHADRFGEHIIRMTAGQTDGRIGLIESVIPPGGGAPPHQHSREDELFHVLSGRLAFICGDESVELGPGGAILLPREVPHRFKNVGDEPARILVTVVPGGFESFFATVAARRPETAQDFAAIGDEYGVTFLAP